jgi:hypothetical protein
VVHSREDGSTQVDDGLEPSQGQLGSLSSLFDLSDVLMVVEGGRQIL